MIDDAPLQRPADVYVPVVSAATLILGFLMMICSPLTAVNLANPPMPEDVAAMDPDDRPAPPPVRPVDAAAVVVFFFIGTTGVAGGLLGFIRVRPGRGIMIAFCLMTLVYITAAIGYRLTGGLTDLFESVPVDAPRGSALGAFFVWTLVPIAIAVGLLILSLKYLLRRDVARSFRGVRFGTPQSSSSSSSSSTSISSST
ncbi:MAG: hypothetical protein AAGI46_02770 [Planctomycetota bacterium]